MILIALANPCRIPFNLAVKKNSILYMGWHYFKYQLNKLVAPYKDIIFKRLLLIGITLNL